MANVIAFPPRPQPAPSVCAAMISPREHLEGLAFVLAMAVDIHAGETKAFYAGETGDFRADPEDVHAWLFGDALDRPDLIPQLADLAQAHSTLTAAYCDELVVEAAYWQSLLVPGGAV